MAKYFIVTLTCLQVLYLSAQNEFESEIRRFESMDSINPPPKNALLFLGSSSIRLWDSLSFVFPNRDIINRGFGGSEFSDAIYFFHRIVTPYQPSKIVVYEGDNDIANGKDAQTVLHDFIMFASLVKEYLPETALIFISIKPSPARWKHANEMKRANRLIREYTATDRRLKYVDIYSEMLGENGRPIAELYLQDSLHMTREGYRIWKHKLEPLLD